MSSASEIRRASSIAIARSDSSKRGWPSTVPRLIAPSVRPRAISGATSPDVFAIRRIARGVLRVVRHRLGLGLQVRQEQRLSGAERRPGSDASRRVGGYCARRSRTSSVFSGSAWTATTQWSSSSSSRGRSRGSRRAPAPRARRSPPACAPSRGSRRAARWPGERKRRFSSARLRRVTSARIATAETIAPSASRTGAALISSVRVSLRPVRSGGARRSSPRRSRSHARAASPRCRVARAVVVAEGDGAPHTRSSSSFRRTIR